MSEQRRRGFWFFVSLAIVSFSIPVALVAGFAVASVLDSEPVVIDIPSTLSRIPVATPGTDQDLGTQTFVLSSDDEHPALWGALVLIPIALGVVALVQIARRR